jgi:hypothetical protein
MCSDYNRDEYIQPGLSAEALDYARLEENPSLLYLLNPELKIVYCNKAWDRFAMQNGGMEWLRANVVGQSVLEATSGPLTGFYAEVFAKVTRDGRPWQHDFECSSPDVYRLFHMRALPLEGSSILIENSLRIEHPHGKDRPAMSPIEAMYRNEHAIIVMCAHCRRTRRKAMPRWDWVPAFVADSPTPVSHGLCETCRTYYFS